MFECDHEDLKEYCVLEQIKLKKNFKYECLTCEYQGNKDPRNCLCAKYVYVDSYGECCACGKQVK